MTANQSVAERLKGILSEPTKPTDSQAEAKEPAEQSKPEAETLESDTKAESKRRKAKLGDIEVEFEIFSDDIDPEIFEKSLMMESDYRKKTMSLSDEKKALESQKAELDAIFSDAKALIEFEADQLASDELKELRESDPDEYLNRIESTKKKAEKYNDWKSKRDKDLLDKQQKDVEQELARLTQVIPEFLDDGKKQEGLTKAAKWLQTKGFSESYISSVYKPEEIEAFYKAAMYDEIMSQDLSKKRVKSAPKTLKSEPNVDDSQKKSEYQQLRDNLKKSGHRNDAQAAIKKLLGE